MDMLRGDVGGWEWKWWRGGGFFFVEDGLFSLRMCGGRWSDGLDF